MSDTFTTGLCIGLFIDVLIWAWSARRGGVR